MILYRIIELMLPSLIQRYYKKNRFFLYQLENERLTEILQTVRSHTFYDRINTIYQSMKPFLDKKCLFF